MFLGRRNFIPELFADCEWTASGRDAFIAIAKNFRRRKTLHVPEFFCPLTLSILEKFFDVKTYVDLPTESIPRFETINANPGDIVLVLDIFGMRSRDTWVGFLELRPDLVFLEDHSHAPFSEWAKNSSANFTMASLRKCFPIASGGYVGGADFKRVEGPKGGRHEDDKLRGQYLRKLYMDGCKISPDSFVGMFNSVEAHYNSNTDFFEMGDVSKEVLFSLDVEKMQKARRANFEALKSELEGFGGFYNFINADTADDMSLFNPMLVLNSGALREALRKDMLFRRIYTPVLWDLDREKVSGEAYDVSSRIIDIPLDFRYGPAQVEYVASALKHFAEKNG